MILQIDLIIIFSSHLSQNRWAQTQAQLPSILMYILIHSLMYHSKFTWLGLRNTSLRICVSFSVFKQSLSSLPRIFLAFFFSIKWPKVGLKQNFKRIRKDKLCQIGTLWEKCKKMFSFFFRKTLHSKKNNRSHHDYDCDRTTYSFRIFEHSSKRTIQAESFVKPFPTQPQRRAREIEYIFQKQD